MATELDCCVLTFNCGRELLDADLFATRLHESFDTASKLPDIIALALEEVAPIAYSFLGGSYITPYVARFARAIETLAKLDNDSEGAHYELVASKAVGMTALLVFAQPDTAGRIDGIEAAAVRIGKYELGNKGAAAIRLHIGGDSNSNSTSLAFASVHLPPGEAHWEQRNDEWRTIVENAVFEPVDGSNKLNDQPPDDTEETAPLLSPQSRSRSAGLYSKGTYLFVAGDMNYRTSDRSPKPGEEKNWPLLHETSPSRGALRPLWKNDQLNREITAGRTLHHLRESEVNFAPTYKYSDAARKRAASSDDALAHGETPWASHRFPSWCDRILYLSRGNWPQVSSYVSLPLMPSSDHRAVVLRATVSTQPPPDEEQGFESPFDLSSDAKARAVRSRVKEVVAGSAMFVALTWEGRLIFVGVVAGIAGTWAALSSFL